MSENELFTSNEEVEDIAHEDITPEETEKAPDKGVIPIEKAIHQEVAKFNLPRAAIAKFKEEFAGLENTAPEDKKGIKALNAAHSLIRKRRTAVEKVRKSVKAYYIAIGDAIDAEAKDLTALLREIETPLSDRIDFIEEEAEREQQRLANEAKERLQARVTELLESGMTFNGSYYVVGEMISMDVVTLKDMEPAQYEEFKGRVIEANARVTELRLKAEAEKAKQEKELKEKQEANEKEATRLREANEALQKQKDELEKGKKELQKMVVSARAAVLEGMGFIFHQVNESYSRGFIIDYSGKQTLIVSAEEITGLDTVGWVKKQTEIINAVTDFTAKAKAHADEIARKAEEKRQLEERGRLRRQQVHDKFGMVATGNYGGAYVRHTDVDAEPWYVTNEVIDTLDDTLWAAALEELEAQYKAIQALEAEEKKRLAEEAEKERQAKLGDALKLHEYIIALTKVQVPEIEDADMGEALFRFANDMNEFGLYVESIAKPIIESAVAVMEK